MRFRRHCAAPIPSNKNVRSLSVMGALEELKVDADTTDVMTGEDRPERHACLLGPYLCLDMTQRVWHRDGQV